MKERKKMSFETEAVVEIPFGSMYKYEVDKETGELTVDRPLPAALPYNYGFIPDTLYRDGDPLDVCIIGKHPIFPLTRVQIKVLGAFICDDNGDADDKLVAVVVGDNFSEIKLSVHLQEIRDYLSSYKDGFEVLNFVEATEAYDIFLDSEEMYADATRLPDEQSY